MRKIIVTVCIKENDKLLMVQEAQPKAYKLWNFPAGHLDDRENVFTGAIREAKEETGFDVELISLISIQNYSRKDEEILRVNFNAKIISGEIAFDENEILDVKWIPIKELENMTDEEIRGTWNNFRYCKRYQKQQRISARNNQKYNIIREKSIYAK